MAITPLQPGAAPANPDVHQPSRRKVLGLFAAAPVATLPVPVAAASTTEWDTALAEFRTCQAAVLACPAGRPCGSEAEARFDQLAAEEGHAIRRLISTPSPDLSALQHKIHIIRDNFGAADEEDLTAFIADLQRFGGL